MTSTISSLCSQGFDQPPQHELSALQAEARGRTETTNLKKVSRHGDRQACQMRGDGSSS